ncbi:hypothetical protein ODZ84_18000 [Chryseobacterium fluminis]|uniref:hypothetical protein n=1 Tax=Chryseobacterium fluminis TaxID=2983606 RepID=UPI002259C98C|nr:hypothetical protein [Chryseobacterium sp. MMS21-Ot14]UZT97076.1 hypothetical protein ODZ84_18000 [Chryseobacterium sp. MMS21-Ot14]
MLNQIVDIINASSSKSIEDNVLFCQNVIDDKSFLDTLYNSELIENSDIDDYSLGDSITLEFSLPRLSSIGFFETRESFLRKNYYNIPRDEIYIFERSSYLSNDLPFHQNYSLIVNLISKISSFSKHTYEDAEVLNAIILREEISLFLPLTYSYEDLESLNVDVANRIEQFVSLLQTNAFVDKKNVYLNFLVEYLVPKEENIRFSYLIQNFYDYDDKAESSYNYYLRNFSYNKLKVELDSKALEFNQKLQSVINDSQTKLIAIPTALVFTLSTLDYQSINSFKNYLLIIGLIIFCVFIQIFINNQKSSIGFISDNILQYKSTFEQNKIIELEKSFSKVEKEKIKQSNRILLMQLFLWLSPLLSISTVLFLNAYKLIAILTMLAYIICSLIFYFILVFKK